MGSLLTIFQKGTFIYLNTRVQEAKIYNSKFGELNSENIIVEKIDSTAIAEGNYAKMLEGVLNALNAKGKKISAGTAVTVILPNTAVTIDYFNMPTMKKKNLSTALRTNFSKLYKNNSELYMVENIVMSNKKNTVLKCVIIQKAITASIKATLTKANLGLKTITCEAFCLADGAAQINSKSRKHDFLLLDVHDKYADIVICGKDKVYGFTSLPYGNEIIKNNEIVSEYDYMDNDIAELAVLNAKENAKAKKLTVSIDLDTSEYTEEKDDKAEETVAEEVVAEKENEINEINPETDGKPIESEHKLSKEEMVSLMRDIEQESEKPEKKTTEEDYEDEDDEVAQQPIQDKIKLFIRKPKKYPKFMLRDIPETQEGFVSENFRIFQKHLLLYALQCKLIEYFPKMEFALVNIKNVPENIIVAAGQQNEDSLQLRSICSDADKTKDVYSELVLFGATHLRAYSKNPKL